LSPRLHGGGRIGTFRDPIRAQIQQDTSVGQPQTGRKTLDRRKYAEQHERRELAEVRVGHEVQDYEPAIEKEKEPITIFEARKRGLISRPECDPHKPGKMDAHYDREARQARECETAG